MSKELIVINNDQVDIAVKNEESYAAVAQIQKYIDTMYDITQKYEAAKYEYDTAKVQLEVMCSVANETFGFKSLKGRYNDLTFIPGVEGSIEIIKKIDEKKVKEIMEYLGVSEEEYMVTEEKVTRSRKDSIRYQTK